VQLVAAPGETVTLAGVNLTGVNGLSVSGFGIAGNIAIDSSSAVTVANNTITEADSGVNAIGVYTASNNLTITGNMIRGGIRNIMLYGGVQDPAGWVNNITISDNNFGGPYEDDINLAGARQVLIDHNTFSAPQVTGGHDDGIQSEGSDQLTIRQNLFAASPPTAGPDQGIILGDADPPNQYWKVTNTTVVNNIIHWRGSGIALAGTLNTDIVNNTSVDNLSSAGPAAGLMLDTKGKSYLANVNTRVWNNILSNIDSARVGAVPLAFEDYNCVARGGTGPHDITADPGFVDHTTYTLAALSACRRTGTPLGAPPDDYNGNPRTNPPDIGAI